MAEYVKVKLVKTWGDNDYYKAGNIVYVSAAVAKKMTTGAGSFGYIIENKDPAILDAYYASKNDEEE